MIPADATARGLDWLDATCPLVSKVHRQAERHAEAGRHILFVGHKGHPEVIGTMGQVPDGTDHAGRNAGGCRRRSNLPRRTSLAFLTQTTLSVDDTRDIVAALRTRFPEIARPRAEDICYATSNRQTAVEGDRGALRSAAGDRRSQQFQFAAAGRSGRTRRHSGTG